MNERLEGRPESKIIQLIKKRGYNEWGANIELATVTAAPPALKIKIDNMPTDLEADDLIVSQHLTKHTRKITIRNAGKTDISDYSTSGSTTPYPENPPGHTHGISSISISGGNFTLTDGELDYLDELKVGDRVIVSSINDGQLYVILDRAVIYSGA